MLDNAEVSDHAEYLRIKYNRYCKSSLFMPWWHMRE